MKYFTLVYLICTLFLINRAVADVPRVISYQGVLTDANGKPIIGTKDITFRLQAKNSSPTKNWTETVNGVVLNGGLFSVPLGLTSNPQGFPSLDGEYDIVVSIDGKDFKVPLYSAVHALSIADNCVTSEKIKDGEVKSNDIADNAISNNHVRDNSIIGNKIQNSSISFDKLNNGSVEGQSLVWSSGKWTPTITEALPKGQSPGETLVWNGVEWVVQKNNTIPIGTILPFAGDITIEMLIDGWALCDGSSIPQESDYDEIRVIANSYWNGNLPDLRGMFLRGANDVWGMDENMFRTPGNIQLSSTALPRNGFRTSYEGLHQHETMGFKSYYTNGQAGGSATSPVMGNPQLNYMGFGYGLYTSQNGTHNHSISGGDYETRPINTAVNFIIKAK